MALRFDFLVIGSGIAGLSFALKAAEHGEVILLSKAELNETNTRYAQGGIASVMYKPDSFEKHIKDTIVAGSGYCNEDVVRAVVSEAPDRINELIDLGVGFDLKEDGKYDLAKEGGHSEHRVLHNKDKTGEEIQYSLERKVRANRNITVRENCFAIDLLTQHHLGKIVKRHIGGIECYGAYIFDRTSKEVETILSKITVVCSVSLCSFNNSSGCLIS